MIGLAGEDKPQAPGSAPGSAFDRIIRGNYVPPAVTSFDLRGDATLDALIKDGKLSLSAEDAIRLALENNTDINVERFNPYFTLWGIQQGKAVLNPSVLFSTNINRNVVPAASALQGAPTVFNITTLYNLTVHKPFEPGLDVDVNFNTSRNRTNSIFSSLNPSFTPDMSINFTQHLLKDFGRITRGRVLRIARNNYSISEEAFAASLRDVVTAVLNAYWDVVFNDEDIKVKEASRKLAEIVLDQNKIQAQVGTMAPLDVVQAEAEVAAREEAVVLSQFNKRISEDQLKKLISSRPDPGVIPADIVPTSKPDPPSEPLPDVKTAIQRAVETRQEIKELLKTQENNKIQVEYTRNQLKPSLDLVAGYSQNGLGGETILRDYSAGFFNAPIIGITPGGFWDSLDSLFSRRYLGYVLGFTFRIPIGNDDARASSAQAQINYKQGEARIASQRQQIALEVRQAYQNIAMNQALVRTAEVTVRYQQQRLQGEQDKYALGATTTRSIIEAQRDLQDAQSRLLLAKINLIKNRIALDKAVGDTLAVHNIELSQAMKPVK
jgi:outer membrane protein TolC